MYEKCHFEVTQESSTESTSKSSVDSFDSPTIYKYRVNGKELSNEVTLQPFILTSKLLTIGANWPVPEECTAVTSMVYSPPLVKSPVLT